MADVAVLGSLNMDLVVKTSHMPQPGETVRGEDLQMVPGGKGANQAAAAARLGAQVAMIGRVGDDVFGPPLVENLRGQGVDVSHVAIDTDVATGTAVITVDAEGENCIVVSAGANGRVSADDVFRADGLLSRAKILLLQLEVPLATVRDAMAVAARHGVTIVLNSAPACPLPPEMLAQVNYLVLNETEAQVLAGMEVGDVPSAVRAACRLLESGVTTAILTLGEQGALLVTDQGPVHVPARKVQTVDTTAAGDAFIGGLAVALLKGLPLVEAVRYATCAGTLAVTRFGAQTSLPWAAEVQAFYEDCYS